MFLDPGVATPEDTHHLLISVVVPRPIAFVSTLGEGGRTNVAPFSYFNAIASRPPLVAIAVSDRAGDPKDTLRNVRASGEFVANLVSEPMLEAMVRSSGDWPADVSEFEVAGLTPAPSEKVKAPSVAESPVQIECRLHREIPLGDSHLIVGEVVWIRVRDEMVTDGRVDPMKLRAVGRLGGALYSLTREVVKVARPRVERKAAS